MKKLWFQKDLHLGQAGPVVVTPVGEPVTLVGTAYPS